LSEALSPGLLPGGAAAVHPLRGVVAVEEDDAELPGLLDGFLRVAAAGDDGGARAAGQVGGADGRADGFAVDVVLGLVPLELQEPALAVDEADPAVASAVAALAGGYGFDDAGGLAGGLDAGFLEAGPVQVLELGGGGVSGYRGLFGQVGGGLVEASEEGVEALRVGLVEDGGQDRQQDQ